MITEFKTITIEEYSKAQQKNSEKMFNLFDEEGSEKIYKNGNRGLQLMWAIGFTTMCIAKQSINRHLDENIPLDEAILRELIKESQNNYLKEDLYKLLY